MALSSRTFALLAAASLTGCAAPVVDPIEPVSAAIRGNAHVLEVELVLDRPAWEEMRRQDERAARPFPELLEASIREAAAAAGLTAGRPLRLEIDLDHLRLADPARTVVTGSEDRLAGSVLILDPESRERLGMFYVDVRNRHSGVVGLALRGLGVRDRLAREFAGHVARQLAAPGAR